MATKVKLRKKAISGNRQSLYLDFYPPIKNPDTGKETRRQFLKLFVFDRPKNPFDKEHNRETMELAENIRATRQLEVQSGQNGFLSTKARNINFVEYFNTLTAKRKKSNFDNWVSASHHLEQFAGSSLLMADISVSLIEQFKDYLLNAKSRKSAKQKLSKNSAVSYFNKFRAGIKQAYTDGYLTENLAAKVKPIKADETEREFLSIEELRSLAATECKFEDLKRQALFSALTGLRFSDIAKLTWGKVRHSKADGYSLQFRQQKTGKPEYHPISDQAAALLGEPGQPNSRIFPGMVYSQYRNEALAAWLKTAGIYRHVTFHAFRHTFATLQLAAGTDILTVSKMLGHKELKTTQIYTHVLDKAKREASKRIEI
jgi:integrase